mmetsp:Transcript_42499/g.131232  ORF Transcript_42499/g.131232 Transcript_42499/m.131232 type:complete len:306 (-) Transcript_42499:1740-2657(-)
MQRFAARRAQRLPDKLRASATTQSVRPQSVRPESVRPKSVRPESVRPNEHERIQQHGGSSEQHGDFFTRYSNANPDTPKPEALRGQGSGPTGPHPAGTTGLPAAANRTATVSTTRRGSAEHDALSQPASPPSRDPASHTAASRGPSPGDPERVGVTSALRASGPKSPLCLQQRRVSRFRRKVNRFSPIDDSALREGGLPAHSGAADSSEGSHRLRTEADVNCPRPAEDRRALLPRRFRSSDPHYAKRLKARRAYPDVGFRIACRRFASLQPCSYDCRRPERVENRDGRGRGRRTPPSRTEVRPDG